LAPAADAGLAALLFTDDRVQITLPQVAALAPDDKAIAAARKLSAAKNWRDLMIPAQRMDPSDG
jgi:hypothetical protein